MGKDEEIHIGDNKDAFADEWSDDESNEDEFFSNKPKNCKKPVTEK